MDYLTNYYKNQAEQLQEQLNLLQSKLKSLQEDVFNPSWGGPGIPDTEAGTIELENMARQKKRTSLFGPVKQSKEWEELNAEIERRRGRGRSKPAPEPAPAPEPEAVLARWPEPAYEPETRKPSPEEFNAEAPGHQEAGEADFDEGGDYTSSGGYAQSPTSWANRYPGKYPAPQKPKSNKPSRPEFNYEVLGHQEAGEVDYDEGGDYTSSGGYVQSPTFWANRYPGKYTTPQQPKAVAPAAVRGESEMPEQTGGADQPDWVLRWAKKLGDTPEKIEGMRQQAVRQIRSEK
jgi:hypothetical protein